MLSSAAIPFNNSGLQLLSGAYQTFRLHCPIVSREYLYNAVPPPLQLPVTSPPSLACRPYHYLIHNPFRFTNPPPRKAQVSPQILCKSPNQHVPSTHLHEHGSPLHPCLRATKLWPSSSRDPVSCAAHWKQHPSILGSGGVPALALLFLDTPEEFSLLGGACRRLSPRSPIPDTFHHRLGSTSRFYAQHQPRPRLPFATLALIRCYSLPIHALEIAVINFSFSHPQSRQIGSTRLGQYY